MLNIRQEELQRTKETQTHLQALYEKDVRRARKEAFKSSSVLVKTQEELKSARNKFTLMREEVEMQRRKVDAREQDAFAAQYQLVGLQEDIESLRQQKRVIEDEREVLKTSLKEEEVARIAAEGRIALPASIEGEEFASPKKSRAAKDDSFKENIDPQAADEHAELLAIRDELRLERRLRQRMDDQIHFMKMECQFQCCSCRVAERQGVKFLHEGVSANTAVPQAPSLDDKNRQMGIEESNDPFVDEVATPTHRHLSLPLDDSEPLIKFSPTTGTFYKTPSPPKQDTRTQRALTPTTPNAILLTTTSSDHALPSTPPSTPAPHSSPQPSNHPQLPTISTPFPHPIPHLHPPPTTQTQTQTHSHTIKTTTTTVPLATSPLPLSAHPTMTREEALEQIRARRGRARSIASHQGTPRRVLPAGVERRDISAPAGGS